LQCIDVFVYFCGNTFLTQKKLTMKILQIQLLLIFFLFSGLIYAQDTPSDATTEQDSYIVFTLKNNGKKKTIQISIPSGTVTILPKSFYQCKLIKGSEVAYIKKSGRTKLLLTVTADLEGKVINIVETKAKGSPAEILIDKNTFPSDLSDYDVVDSLALIELGAKKLEMARFPGCEGIEGTVAEKEYCAEQNMLEYIYTNFKYPGIARENGIEGTIVARFVLDADGFVINAEIIQGIGGGCDEEYLRLIHAMPKWIPGKVDGIPTPIQFELPIICFFE